MKTMPHIVTVMTPFPHSIESSRTLGEAQAMMVSAEIRHLPVVEAGKLVGVLTERDVKLTLAVASEEEQKEPLTVADSCNFDAYIVECDVRLDIVLNKMSEYRLGAALVTKNGKLVGIFTTSDACRLYSELLRMTYPDA